MLLKTDVRDASPPFLGRTFLRWGLLCLLAGLAFGLAGSDVRARGDLFDEDYADCPHTTRLRDGQIADLAVARDAEEADEVNVSWAATDPATWGLGPNAYSTSLVVILDDGKSHTKILSLGSRKATFDDIKTGVEVKVQLAIVTDTADGDYLISDILEKSINQSLTEPSFGGKWYQIKTANDSDATADGFQFDAEEIKGGMMYYIGYNENFANYKAGTAVYRHRPSTPRLRVGLAHSANEGKDAREDVDFDAYIIRIADSDGDVVDEGDDVATMESNYGTAADKPYKLFIDDIGITPPSFDSKDGTLTVAGNTEDTGVVLNNVRIVKGSKITVGMHLLDEFKGNRFGSSSSMKVRPPDITIIRVGISGANDGMVGHVFANPPDEHRDFPLDTLTSDETYTITAWAINEDEEAISPVATLKVHPVDKKTIQLSTTNGFQDYLQGTIRGQVSGMLMITPAQITSGTLTITEFTVIK